MTQFVKDVKKGERCNAVKKDETCNAVKTRSTSHLFSHVFDYVGIKHEVFAL
jgi:hypothetical protein